MKYHKLLLSVLFLFPIIIVAQEINWKWTTHVDAPYMDENKVIFDYSTIYTTNN